MSRRQPPPKPPHLDEKASQWKTHGAFSYRVINGHKGEAIECAFTSQIIPTRHGTGEIIRDFVDNQRATFKTTNDFNKVKNVLLKIGFKQGFIEQKIASLNPEFSDQAPSTTSKTATLRNSAFVQAAKHTDKKHYNNNGWEYIPSPADVISFTSITMSPNLEKREIIIQLIKEPEQPLTPQQKQDCVDIILPNLKKSAFKYLPTELWKKALSIFPEDVRKSFLNKHKSGLPEPSPDTPSAFGA